MCFAYVDGQEIRAIFVIVVQRDEVAYLAAKRRSRVAAEDQNQWPLPNAIAQMKRCSPVQREQPDIRRGVANAKTAVAPLR
jgi:hypothetical protein